jgi:hypothetical protein
MDPRVVLDAVTRRKYPNPGNLNRDRPARRLVTTLTVVPRLTRNAVKELKRYYQLFISVDYFCSISVCFTPTQGPFTLLGCALFASVYTEASIIYTLVITQIGYVLPTHKASVVLNIPFRVQTPLIHRSFRIPRLTSM